MALTNAQKQAAHRERQALKLAHIATFTRSDFELFHRLWAESIRGPDDLAELSSLKNKMDTLELLVL